MYAMQYELALPADYDMTIIRRRVETKGSLLDAFPGLGLKAYLVRERGKAGSSVNQYAPFYLWVSTVGMGRFLWGGGGFRNILDFIGRPQVAHWTGVGFKLGPARGAIPRAATRMVDDLAIDVDPAAIAERELASLRERAEQAGVHSAAVAIDPFRWQLLRFTLWREANAQAEGTHYEVLHLSRPGIDALAEAAG